MKKLYIGTQRSSSQKLNRNPSKTLYYEPNKQWHGILWHDTSNWSLEVFDDAASGLQSIIITVKTPIRHPTLSSPTS